MKNALFSVSIYSSEHDHVHFLSTIRVHITFAIHIHIHAYVYTYIIHGYAAITHTYQEKKCSN